MVKPPRRPSGPSTGGLPDKETLLRFLREAGEADKSDLARAFGLKGAERRALREAWQERRAQRLDEAAPPASDAAPAPADPPGSVAPEGDPQP